MNDMVRRALNLATAALFELADAKVTVIGIRIEGGRPVVTVDQAPKFLSVRMRVSKGFNTRETTCVGELRGCRIEWSERASINQLTGSAA